MQSLGHGRHQSLVAAPTELVTKRPAQRRRRRPERRAHRLRRRQRVARLAVGLQAADEAERAAQQG